MSVHAAISALATSGAGRSKAELQHWRLSVLLWGGNDPCTLSTTQAQLLELAQSLVRHSYWSPSWQHPRGCWLSGIPLQLGVSLGKEIPPCRNTCVLFNILSVCSKINIISFHWIQSFALQSSWPGWTAPVCDGQRAFRIYSQQENS